MGKYSDFETFKELYQKIKDIPVWSIQYVATNKVIRYSNTNTPMLLARFPIYEYKYIACPLNLKNQNDLFSALINEHVYETKEEAEQEAERLNQEKENIEKIFCIDEANLEL